MNTALATTTDRNELIEVLGTSLYVGAKPESIGLVLDYCQAAQLDPMQKPVHIVPMNTKNPVTNQYEWRDVIMPGIGHYRIQADRAGTMAGISEPEFGNDITSDFKDKNSKPVSIVHPEWCKVSVKKLVSDHIVEFVAKEYWIENYATDSGKSTAPNAMWRKRPRGQLAKCAEAQALRKAFPEVGAQPTAEEMEGKIIDITDQVTVETVEPTITTLPAYSDEKFQSNFSKWEKLISDGKQTAEAIIAKISSKATLSDEQIKKIQEVEVAAS